MKLYKARGKNADAVVLCGNTLSGWFERWFATREKAVAYCARKGWTLE